MTHNQKVLALLSDGKVHTHHELYALHVIGHSRVADLRKQGYAIECWREGDLSLYQLVATSPTDPVAPPEPRADRSEPGAGTAPSSVSSPQLDLFGAAA